MYRNMMGHILFLKRVTVLFKVDTNKTMTLHFVFSQHSILLLQPFSFCEVYDDCLTSWACTNTIQTIQIKLRWALFVTYTIIQSIMRSEMCSLHLTHPSVHTWSSGQPTVQRPGSSRGLPVGDGIRTHNLGLPRVSSPTLYPLGQRLPNCIQYMLFYFTSKPKRINM